MPRREKFSEKVLLGFIITEPYIRSVRSEEEVDAPEPRGFWDRVDLRLGAIKQTNARKREKERERERERETIRKTPTKQYIRI